MGNSARSYALNLLKRRLRSAWELNQSLVRKQVPLDEREQIIAEFKKVNLLNDERFALAWVHTRDRLSPKGDFYLEQELIRKGIDKATIRLVMQTRAEESENEPDLNPNEDELIRNLVERKQRSYKHLPPEVRNRRILAFLARRGFSADRVRRILTT